MQKGAAAEAITFCPVTPCVEGMGGAWLVKKTKHLVRFSVDWLEMYGGAQRATSIINKLHNVAKGSLLQQWEDPNAAKYSSILADKYKHRI